MNPALELFRNQWVKAQILAPSFAQNSLIPHLNGIKEVIRLLVKPYLPVYQLQGQAECGPLTVVYAGLDFAKPFLEDLLFVEAPEERRVGQIPFWQAGRLADEFSADIVIVEAAKQLIHRLPRHNAFVTPEFVHFTLDVRGDWEDVEHRFHKTVHRNDLRRIRKYGYEYSVSHDERDFEEFYHQMYLPTMHDRHQDLSMPMSLGEAHQYFRCGLLFRITRDGEWVAGGVCHTQHDILILDIVGVRNGDVQLLKEGAMAARYYAAIHWAHDQGYRGVNFRGSTACLRLGQFQHKRKWGTSVSMPPYLHRQVWIKVQRMTPAVSEFLIENPFIILDETEKLHGLIIVDGPQTIYPEIREEWKKSYATPGLDSLIVRSINSFFSNEPRYGDRWDLLIPISPSPSFAYGQTNSRR